MSALTASFAPSGTAIVLEDTGMPGVPGEPDEPVFGSTSCVHDLPPAAFSTNCTAGRSTPELHAVHVARDGPRS